MNKPLAPADRPFSDRPLPDRESEPARQPSGRTLEFLPLHQIIRHEKGRMIRYVVNAQSAAAGSPVQQPLMAGGLHFTIRGRSGAHLLALELDTRGLAEPGALVLAITRFDATNPDLPEEIVHTARLAVSREDGDGPVLFSLMGARLDDGQLYRVALRPDGAGIQGLCGVWGCLTDRPLPEPDVEVADAVWREPAYRLEWREHGGRFRISTEAALAGRFGLIPQPIAATAGLEFAFDAPAATVDRLSVLVAARKARGSVPLQLELHDSNGDLILMRAVRPAPRSKAQYVDFDLGHVRFRPGAHYRASLTSPTASPDDCNCVMVNRDAMPGRLPAQPPRLLGADSALARYAERLGQPVGTRGQLRVCAVVPHDHPRPGTALAALARAFPDHTVHAMTLPGDDWGAVYARLAGQDVVIFVDVLPAAGEPSRLFDDMAFLLHAGLVCTIHLDTTGGGVPAALPGVQLDGALQRLVAGAAQTARRCHHALTLAADGRPSWADGRGDPPPDLRALRNATVARGLPHLAVTVVLRSPGEAAGPLLTCLLEQGYGGPVSVLVVDDALPEEARVRLDADLRRHRPDRGTASRMTVTVLRNERALGLGASRNRAFAAVAADVHVFLDAGSLVGRDFLTAHAFAHAHPEVDAVVGPSGIMARGRDPMRLLLGLEADRSLVDGETAPQDPVQCDGFVNVDAGNLSVRAATLHGLGGGSSGPWDPAEGGWEDIGLGLRLYAAGVRIRYAPDALAVRSDPPPSAGAADPEERMRTFDRLVGLHPELPVAARRWAVGTAGHLLDAARRADRTHTPEYTALKARFGAALDTPAIRRTPARPLRVLSYRWHCGHQYELYKLPHQFTLVRGLGPGLTSGWDFEQRPLRPNVRFVDLAELDPSRYDVAILHFDENVLAPRLGAGALPDDWGAAFRWFLANVPLPKVAICHGTPPFVGQYGTMRGPMDRFEIHEAERQELVRLLAEHDVPVVVNAWRAQAEWGFARSRVIWHGFDPQEYPPARHERDVLALGSSMWERPHYRGAYEHQRVVDRLPPDVRVETAVNQDGGLWPRGTNDYALSKFRGYVDRIRAFTAYLDTTRRSPMPRSRGEAMMCGVVPVCLRSDDVDLFIRHGVNGFCGDTPEELADYLVHLCRNRDAARRMGGRARLTAMDLFNHDRYLAAWSGLLDEVAGRGPSARRAASVAGAVAKPPPVPAMPEDEAAVPEAPPALPAERASGGAVDGPAGEDPAGSGPGPVSEEPRRSRHAGGIDWMIHAHIGGWAVDLDRPDEPPGILVRVDGQMRYRLLASLPRSGAAIGNPAHGGFHLTLPEELRDGHPHRIDLMIDGSDVPLNARPIRFLQPDPDVRFIGQVERFNGRTLTGWCHNFARPALPIDLAVIVDSRIQGNLTADQPRPGLRAMGVPSERRGFTWTVPEHLRDGEEHELLFAIASTGQSLKGFPIRFRAHRGTTWRGHLSIAADGSIMGWVYDEDDPGRLVEVDILVDGRPYRRVTADAVRPDLKAMGMARPDCGFRVEAPLPGADPAPAEIRARVVGTGHELPGSGVRLDLARTYRAWIARHDSPDDAARATLRERIAGFPQRPLLSVLMPVHNTPELLLRAAIASVRRQIYPEWELCIADDASTDPRVAEVLAEESGSDPRIRVVRRAVNGHISAASNSALELARGAFVVLLDHDDELSEHALFHVAETILEHPEATLLFSDEDKIDEEGRRFDPYFKSAFNPDLLTAQNCISHLGAYRTDLVRRIGGFTEGLEGSQDHDLALRVVEHSPPGAIRHIPRVLYHWRMVPGSTALAMDAKDYAALAMRRAVENSLARQGRRARLCPSLQPPFLHLRPRLAAWPAVSLLLSAGGDAGRLAACLSALETQTTRPVAETIVVCPADGSDALAAVVAARRAVRLLPADGPPAARRNAAARMATGEVLVFLDDDVEPLHRIWLAELVRQCMGPGVGAVGPWQVREDGRLRSAGYVLGLLGRGSPAYAGQPAGTAGQGGRAVLMQTVSAVTASCLAVRRDRFVACGGFDAEVLPQALHDVDFCLRLPAHGLRCVYTPFARMLSRKAVPDPDPAAAELDALKARWGQAFAEDPYYSPNLTLEATGAQLAFPPRPAPSR